MAGGRMYEMAFRLNAKLGKSYNSTFASAEAIASKTFSKIAKLGGTVLGGVGIADMANTYKDFQQSMANTGAIAGVDKTSSEFKSMEKAAMEAGRTTTKTAQEAADALGYMKLAGWDTADSINSLMPVLRLSEATGADLATTSDLVTDSMSAMGLKSEELSTYLDMTAKANNAANHSATQLMEGIIGSGGAARAAGVDMYDLSTALGILADNGTKGSEAGTAMNAILVRMTTHDKAATAFEKLGVSVFDATGNFRGLENILVDLNSAMEGMSTEDIDFYLKNIAGTQYFSRFKYLLDSVKKGSANTSEFTNRWKELNSQMHNSAGSLDKMAEAMNDTLGGALAILGSASDDMKIQIMKEIEPTITPIIRKIADVLPSVGAEFASFVRDIVSKAKNLGENLKPVFLWIVENFDKVKVGISALAGAFAAAKIAHKISDITGAVKTFFSVVKANPIMLLVEAVAALGVALYEAHRQAVAANLESHFGKISISVEEAGRIAESVVNKKSFDKLITAMDIQDKLKEQESALQGYISELEKMNTLIEFNIELTPDDKESYKENVKNYINGVLKYIQDEWQSQKLLFSDNQFMLNIINTDMSGTYESVKGIGEHLIKMVNEGISEGDLNELKEKVAEAIRLVEEYKSKVAINTEKEKNKILVSELVNGNLDEESTQYVLEQINTSEREIQEKSIEAAAAKKTDIEQAYERGSITGKERDTQLALSDKQISMARADSLIRSQEYFLGGADEKFGGFINRHMEKVDTAYGEMAKAYRQKAQEDGAADPSIFLKRGSQEEEFFQNLKADTNYSGKDALEAESLNEYMGWVGNLFENSDELMEKLPKDSEQYQKLKALKKKYDLYSEGTRNESSIFSATPESVINTELFHDKMTEIDAVPVTVDFTPIPEMGKAYSAVSEATKTIKQKFEETSVETKVEVKPVPGMEKAYSAVSEATKTIQQNFEGTFLEAKVPTKVESVMNDVLAAASVAANREKVKNGFEQPMSAGVPTNAQSVMNQELAASSVAANRGTIKNNLEQPMSAGITTNATVKPGIIDTSIFEKALEDSIVTGIAKGVGRAAEKAKASVNVTSSGGNISVSGIECDAKGTEYTPDTFIAGEKGAELITGAQGRKVFTALETGNIFTNIGKIKDTLISAVGAINIFEKLKRYKISDIFGENQGIKPERIVKSSGNINNNSNISVTINNNIKIEGSDAKNSDNLKTLIDKILRESTGGMAEAVKDAVMEAIEKNNERKVRLQNG